MYFAFMYENRINKTVESFSRRGRGMKESNGGDKSN
jgi:hypothetical protein